MQDEDEVKQIIVCAPVDWEHTADSIKVDGSCGHEVWVAPAGQRILAAGGEAHCVPCAVPIMKEHGLAPEAAPGVLEDIERDKGGWERAKMEAFMRQVGMTPNG